MHKICVVTLNEENRFENKVEILPHLTQENKWFVKILNDGQLAKKLVLSENPIQDSDSAEDFLEELHENGLISSGWYRVHVPNRFRGDVEKFQGYIGG